MVMGLLFGSGMLGSVEEDISDERVRLSVYFRPEASLSPLCGELTAAGAVIEGPPEHVPDYDWNETWRQSVQPVLVAPGMWASPSWRPPRMHEGDTWIRIEPATAFGTGHHETTRLAAGFVAQTVRKHAPSISLLDIGTGSGILCFCARACGAHMCIGVDTDPFCMTNLVDNIRDNPGIEPNGFAIGPTRALSGEGIFDAVVMNILFTHSSPLLAEVKRLLRSGGEFIWSGLLVSDRSQTVGRASEYEFGLVEERTDGEWWAGRFLVP